MTFGSTFGRVLSPTFQPKSQAKAAAGGVLIYDTFTDTDGTLLKNHTISPTNTPATAWATVSGKTDEKITGNRTGYGSNVHCWSYVDAGVADCKLTSSLLLYQSNTIPNGTGFWIRGGAYFVVYHYTGGRAVLSITGSDKTTVLAQQNPLITFDHSVLHTLTVILNGTTITGQIDDGAVIPAVTYTSATTNQTTTTHGLARYYYNLVTYFDDFKIETL